MEYQEFVQLMLERYSCRSYDASRPVSDQLVDSVLEAARLAPSACNRQPWMFVVVRNEARRHALLAQSRPAFKEAPVLIAAIGLHDRVWRRRQDNKDHTDVDVTIAVQQMCLAATTLGLGTCWICSFDPEAARRELQLPDYAEPIALLPLGYPTADSHAIPKDRLPLDDIKRCEVFS